MPAEEPTLSYRFIRYELPEPGIAVVTLARPERLNALHGPLLVELRDAVERIERDPGVRVFLLSGAPRADGRPCFCAGADLKAAAEGLAMDELLGPALTSAIDDLLKPSIAVVDGVCSTGGVELALACDLRLVGESAEISDWHLKNLGTGLGGWGGSTRWARLVGVANAKRVILTGQVVSAPEAFRIGFAQGMYPSSRLWDEAMAMARGIAAMNPDGLRLTLAHYDHTMLRPEGDRGSAFFGALRKRSSCCAGLAGESPAAVGAGAPRSRPRIRSEIDGSERGVESPQGPVWVLGGERGRGPNESEPLQLREMKTRKGGMAEPIISRRRQQTALGDRSGAGRSRSTEGGTRPQSSMEQERPSSTAWVGRSGGYKPKVKFRRVERESEGLVVLVRPREISEEGRGPAWVALVRGGKCEGMAS